MAPKDLTAQYSESFNTLSDAQKQEIRKQILGLTKEEEIDYKKKDAYLISELNRQFLGGKVGEQDAFRGLAADLLKTTVDKLKQQKAKEAEFDLYKGLPGFSEIANMGGSLSNSILGELGGAAGMAGMDAGSLLGGGQNLEDSLTNMAGLGFLQGAQYNWQKWFDGELSKRYENMKEIKGEVRLTDGKNVNEAKYLSIAAPTTITADTTLTLPNGAGTAGQILSTDGSGNLSWVNDSAGNPAGTNGQVQTNDGGTFGAISEGTSGQVNFKRCRCCTNFSNCYRC